MHRSQELMNELRRAKAEVDTLDLKVADLNAEIARITQELGTFPALSDRMAVEITEDDVTFLTSGAEFVVTRDELQNLVELLGGEPEEDEEEDDEEEEELPDWIDDRAVASLVVDEVTEKALLHSSRGNWYYRVRSGNPLKTIFSDGKTWKFRQFLVKKARNKMPQKLVIEVITRAKNGKPCQHVLTRTLWFGGSPESK